MTDHPTSALPIFFRASLIGAGLLSAIYFILVLLGAMYAPHLANVPPTEILGYIATQTLGSWAAPIVSCAVLLACLTTAIVLASLFADFLKNEITKQRISTRWSLGITLLITFCISTLQFSGIMRFICPILELIYPALIVLTVVSIFHKLFGLKIIRMPVAIAILLKLLSTV
jgi:LIVCS family branched-chain amino acid:cation transporter